MTVRVMRTFNVAAIFFRASSFTLSNVLRAGGDARFTMLVSMTSMWLFRVLLCDVFLRGLHLGLVSIWAGMYVDWIFRSLCFLLRYRSGRWVENKVI